GSGEGEQPAFLDLDGDGDRDLLIGLCGQLVWYRRGGTAGNPTWARVNADPIGYGVGSCSTSPGAGDWDGDGRTDLVIGEHWGVLRFFRRESSLWSEGVFPLPFDLQGDSAPALTDWDGDGDLDMLVGQAHGHVHRYTNTGSRASPAWRYDGVLLTLPWTNHPHPFPAFADIDGDGDQDLFIGEGSWEGPDAGGNIRYYDNAGTPAAPDWRLVTANWLGLDVGGWSTPAFADIDGDGDLDCFVGDEQGTLTYVRNTGSPTSPRWATPVRPYAGLDLGSYSAPAFLDVDRDGDLDILSGVENGSLAYARNAGTARSPAWELVTTQYPPIQAGDRTTPAAADLDGDGKPDLMIGDGDGGLNLYLYRGPGTPPSAGDTYLPGDRLQIAGTLRLHSPAITAATNIGAIGVRAWLGLLMVHDGTGKPLAAQNYFQSTMLTPSGFPIQHNRRSMIDLQGAEVDFDALRHAGGHALEGRFEDSVRLPEDLPPGTYRPLIHLTFNDVPTNTDWLAAYVTYNTSEPFEALLPPIRVERPGQPLAGDRRLIWRLLMDDVVQGTRGAGAREDWGTFELASQIVFQGAPYYVPPVDVRTGQPIVYRLEPFLPMISYTDRRMPTPPLIPFRLPGGQLCVTLREPDGGQRNLGCEVFAQSFNRSKTTRAGEDLNIGTVQLESVYSLKAASDRFRVTLNQYGHHTVAMSGMVEDLWGNRYAGGGTYDLWVAHPLDIDPGVLPGTPLAAGDAFHPTFQFYPRVPAQVSLTLTHYPESDPSRAVTVRRTGQANPYGYYAGAPIALNQPGEVRVDLTATYTDPSGVLYMGAMAWGSVVMTPPSQTPHLVAHGRRGVDSLTSVPGNAWFVSCRDLPIRAGDVPHTLNPYWNGDILWSRMVDAPGECPA
ncbi:MAG: VCBS repeat-containing protein, partial [Anaerolineae bacterium]